MFCFSAFFRNEILFALVWKTSIKEACRLHRIITEKQLGGESDFKYTVLRDPRKEGYKVFQNTKW